MYTGIVKKYSPYYLNMQDSMFCRFRQHIVIEYVCLKDTLNIRTLSYLHEACTYMYILCILQKKMP